MLLHKGRGLFPKMLKEGKSVSIRNLMLVTSGFIAFFFSCCDQHSAIDTDEYVRKRDSFASEGKVVRLTVYSIPDVGKAKFWKESSLINKKFPSYSITGEHAHNLWTEICTRGNSTDIDTETREQISYGIVVENARGGKYFLMLERLHRDNQGLSIGVYGFEDRVWWFMAKDKIWDMLEQKKLNPRANQ